MLSIIIASLIANIIFFGVIAYLVYKLYKKSEPKINKVMNEVERYKIQLQLAVEQVKRLEDTLEYIKKKLEKPFGR